MRIVEIQKTYDNKSDKVIINRNKDIIVNHIIITITITTTTTTTILLLIITITTMITISNK